MTPVTAGAPAGAPRASVGRLALEGARRWPFFREELLRVLRGRTMKLVAAMMLYAVLATAFLMQRPPAEMVRSVELWFGPGHVHQKLLGFIWTDAAMNKLAVLFGTVLAGGIIVDERARGSWDVLASKPVTVADYFTVRLLAATAAFASAYVVAVLLGVVWFSLQVPGFDAASFLALSAVHLFAACFAVGFAGLMAVTFRRKLTAMLASILVLLTLVGLSFVGFYWPAQRAALAINPFFHGVALVARVGELGAGPLLERIVVLLAFDVAVLALARWRAAALTEEV